jgi:hypothetical protein
MECEKDQSPLDGLAGFLRDLLMRLGFQSRLSLYFPRKVDALCAVKMEISYQTSGELPEL